MTRRRLRLALSLVAIVAASAVVWASLPASDNFDRADENPIGTASGGNTYTAMENNMRVVTNRATGASGAANNSVFDGSDTFDANCDEFSQITEPTVSDGGPLICGAAGPNYYWYEAKPGASSSLLRKNVGGTFSNLQTLVTGVANGDILKITKTGSTIQVYRNGAQLGSDQTDVSLTSGAAGWAAFANTTTFDNWSANNSASATKTLTLLGVGSQEAAMRDTMRRFSLSALLVAALMPTLQAQAQTTTRFYMVPKVGDGSFASGFRAKYIADDCINYSPCTGAVAGVNTEMDYGLEPVMFAAVRFDGDDDTAYTAGGSISIGAQPDVLSFLSTDIDTNITSINLPTIKAQLEALGFPSGWINTSHTPRDILRFVRQGCSFYQRYAFLAGVGHVRLFGSGITLDSTVGQLAAGVRANLLLTADQLLLDRTGITNGTTLRVALRQLWPQLPTVHILGIDLH